MFFNDFLKRGVDGCSLSSEAPGDLQIELLCVVAGQAGQIDRFTIPEPEVAELQIEVRIDGVRRHEIKLVADIAVRSGRSEWRFIAW